MNQIYQYVLHSKIYNTQLILDALEGKTMPKEYAVIPFIEVADSLNELKQYMINDFMAEYITIAYMLLFFRKNNISNPIEKIKKYNKNIDLSDLYNNNVQAVLSQENVYLAYLFIIMGEPIYKGFQTPKILLDFMQKHKKNY